MRNRFESIEKIGLYDGPLLQSHGTADEIVPFVQGRKLFEAAGEPKRFYAIEGARHNDTYFVGGEPYLRAWETFLESLSPDEGD